GIGTNGLNSGGTGGAGVVSAGNSMVIDSGTIAGGMANDGFGAQADAIDFSGGGNTLVLEAGSVINGNVVSTSGSTNGGDTLALGGDTNASGGNSFNMSDVDATLPGTYTATQYVGFANFLKEGSSTWTLTGNGSSSQNWMISGGTLIGNSSSLMGNLTFNPATGAATPEVIFNQSANGTFAGLISGNGNLLLNAASGDVGQLILTANNTYSGTTTIEAGTLQVGNGGSSGSLGSNTGVITDNGTLAFDLSGTTTLMNVIGGSGSFEQMGTGTTILNGVNSYTGGTTVSAGTLEIGDATHGNASIAGDVTVDSGGTLRGHGTIGGNALIDSGGILAPGGSIGTLTVAGNLTAAQGSLLDYSFGAPAASNPFSNFGTGDSVSVGGNLSLNGATLNVTDAGGMGAGLYNLFTYGGSLSETNGGIALGTTPTGSTLSIQNLSSQKQINLIDSTGLTLNFWNANGQASATQLGGGSGTWSNTNAAWTDANADVTLAMQPLPGFAIFGGTPGTVTVDDSAGAVTTTGMQFASSGYTLTGNTLTLASSGGAAPILRVGDGNSASASWTATIDNVLAGSAGLDKTDYGTLILGGSNTYAGGTTISGGMLQISSDVNLGAASGGVTLDGGILGISGTSDTTTARSVTLGSAGGGLDIEDAGNTFTLASALSGTGGFAKLGAGSLILTGANSYSGGTTIAQGLLQIGNGGASATLGTGNVLDNGALSFDTSGSNTLAGVLSGTGSLAQMGSGTTTLTANNSYSGTTMIDAGTLQVGSGGSSGSLGSNTSAITDNGTLALDLSGTTTLMNAISGIGSLTQMGSGTTILTGANSYSGTTTIEAGTLQVGNGGSSGSLGSNTGAITDNGTLALDLSGTTTLMNAISGSGSLIQMGTGTTILDGLNSYSGGTTVSAGTLEIGDANSPTAAIAGDVSVASGATLRGHGTIGGSVTNAGTVMPGGSMGILTINGNYTQSAGATLALGVSPQTVAGTGYSQLQVGGTASLAGELLIEPLAGNYNVGSTYDLLHAAGGVSGTFASTFNNPAFAAYLTPTVSYAADDVTLKLNANPAAFSSSVPNFASTNSLALASTFQTVLGGAGSAPGMGMGLGRKGAWVQYTGDNGGLGGTHQSTRIAALGFGVAPEHGLVVGGALTADNTTSSQGNTRVDGRPKAAFVYAIANYGKVRAAVSLGAGSLRADSTRLMPTLGLAASARSTGSFIGFAARVDSHYGLGNGVFVEPYASTSYVHSHYGSTTESGAGLLDITYGGFSQTLWRNSAGVRLGRTIALSNSTLTPWVQVGGEGFTGNRNPLSTEMIGAQAMPVSGTALPGGAWTAAAGLDWQGQGPWRLKLAWLGVHGHHYHSNGGTVLLQYVW
ncbi:MAG: beta strand repeat-containing protein, partial [Metallibacterium sp.]